MKYCECGRRIKVKLRGRWIEPKRDHDQCGQCHRSFRDSCRVRR